MQQQPSVFTRVFGHFSWNSPPWLKKLVKLFWSNPWRGIGYFIVFLLVLFTGIMSYHWYQNRPKPTLIISQITPPAITPNDKKLIPKPLTIDFGIKPGEWFSTRSVAPLTQIGQPIYQGIQLSPVLPGQWQWQNESQLTFTPTQDWPAGQTYHITFQPSVFADHIQLASYQEQFSTLPLALRVEDLKFYQDLKNPQINKIVGTLTSNFPLDEQSLSKHTRLIMQAVKDNSLNLAAQTYTLSITYDQHRRTAYLESEPIALPAIPRFVNLIVNKGVRAQQGPSQTKKVIKKKVLVPDASSFLQIKETHVSIERDPQDHPHQTLTVETTIGITQAELLNYLQVYVLPQDYPATSLHSIRKDFRWSTPGEVTPEILKLATPLQLEPLPEEHPFPTSHHFQFHINTPSYLYIQIAKGLPGLGHFVLAKSYETVKEAPDYPQDMHFLYPGSLMALSSDKKLTLSTRGIPKIKFSISQVLEPQINHLITQTYGDFQNPTFLHDSFGPEAISQVFSEFRSFNQANLRDLQYTTLDLAQHLAQHPHSLGLFLLKAQAWDSKNETATGVEKSRLILITDMNLLIKDNADDTHNVFVQSITKGTPVADVQVELIGKNGLPLVKAVTDAQGHIHFPSVKDFKEESEPIAYVARHGKDLSLIPYERYDRKLNYSRFPIEGVNSSMERQLSAYLFTDRDLYRPYESMHLGIIIKNRFAQDPIPGLPLEAIITDPRGHTVWEQKLTLPSSHFLTLDYAFPLTALTGHYTVNLYVVKDQQRHHLLGSKTVRVEEFLPDRMKMQAYLTSESSTGWLSPTGLKASIHLWNLFGTPAAQHRVKAKIILIPKALHFARYSDYSFVDPLHDPSSTSKFFTEDLTETLTNAEGHSEFNLNLERFSTSIYQLSFLAEGFEADSGRAVSAEATALIAPLDYLVGYKPAQDLSFLKHNTPSSVHFIAINSELESLALNDLQIQLLSIKKISTLVKKPDGTYHYQSINQEVPTLSQPFAIDIAGNHFPLPTDTIGDFALVLKDAQGHLLSKLNFSVVGENSQTDFKQAELLVKLDKKDYQAGDTIEMHITAPYTGAGLITIERDKVYAHKWFQADAHTSVQTITIPSDFQGNGYVNVTYVRAWNSDEIFVNPLSYAVIPFHINRDPQTLHIKLETPSFVRSGEILPIQFSVDQPAQMIIYAVDEGILQTANYRTPNPLIHFFPKHALMVKTLQIADLILPKYSDKRPLSAPGGDGHLQLLAKNLNPFKRKAEPAVVFWSGIVEGNSTPQTIPYRVPDYFNGNLRIMAVAVAPQKLGHAEAHTEAQAYFVIQPHVPTFIAPGDQVTLTASITNCLKEEDNGSPVIVNLTASPHLEVLSAMQDSFILLPEQERVVTFQIKAKEQLGEAQIFLSASQGDKSSHIQSTLSVRPASAYHTHLISGYTSDMNNKISVTRQLYPEHRSLQVIASPNPLILAHGLQNYLATYPYDCTEQLISKAFAQLVMAQHSFFEVNSEKALEQFKQVIQILRERQNHQGGFNYWPGQRQADANQIATLYAMDYLTEAKRNGYPVPVHLFKSGIHYLENFAKSDPSSLSGARMQAYAIYLLTRNEMVTTPYLSNLQLNLVEKHKNEWKKDVACVYMAATYKLLQQAQEAEALIKNYPLQRELFSENQEFYSALLNQAQSIILLARHFPEHVGAINRETMFLLAQRIASNQLNTLSAAYSIQALSAYAQINSQANQLPLSIYAIKNDHQEETLVSLSPLYEKVNVDTETQQLGFRNPTNRIYFYQMNQTGFDRMISPKAIKKDLEITRKYYNQTGQEIQNIELGQQVEVRIQARTLNQQTVNHVAIVDLLPGGFEIIPHSVRSSGCDYVDVREDRIVFYGSLYSSLTELSYRLRATHKGDYQVPPILAQSMYHSSLQAQSVADRIKVQ